MGREEKKGGLLLPIHMPWQEIGHWNRRIGIKRATNTKQAKWDFGSTVLRSTCHGIRHEPKILEQEDRSTSYWIDED
jgi:hypothetical protein